MKARLVARGFEENLETRADSPMACKESQRLFLGITSTMAWEAKTIDIKAAFSQGNEIKREVILKPPNKAGALGKLWKLKKRVYGLNDASRNWYFSVRKELLLHGGHQSSVDPGMFFWHEKEELLGMFIMHVDDFIWSGKATFEERVIDKICSTFCCSKESDDSFRYIGLNIQHSDNGLILHQRDYIKEIHALPITFL